MSDNQHVDDDDDFEDDAFADELEESTQQKRTRRLIQAGVVVALVVIVSGFFYLRHQREEARQQQIEADQAKQEGLIQKALADFGADAGWEQRVLDIEDKRGSIYTVDFEGEWTGRTIAFRGRIVDVSTSGPASDRVQFEFRGTPRLAFGLHSVSFSVTCPTKLVRDSIADNDRWTTYLVVAEISHVESTRDSVGDYGTLGTGSCRAMVPYSTYLPD